MCTEICMDMCMDMCIHMCIDMGIAMRMDMCMDTRTIVSATHAALIVDLLTVRHLHHHMS